MDTPKTLLIENVYAPTRRGLEEVALLVAGGRIARIMPARESRETTSPLKGSGPGSRRLDGEGRFAVPGFIDLHVHGAAGVDVMSASDSPVGSEVMPRLSRCLAAYGVTGFCATTVSAERALLRLAVEAVAEAAEVGRAACGLPPAGSWPGARVLGCHLEGPFLSPARRGVQPLEALRPPDLREIQALHTASRGTLRVVTLAPELPGALEVARWLAARGVVVAAGHTDATYEEAVAGFAAGITHSAHTFNGMRPLLHRDPGVVGAVMNCDAVLAEVIADGVHVSPHVVRLLCRAKGMRRVAVVSDLTHLAGLEPGEYDFAGRRVVVRADRAFIKETGALAGSVTPMNLAFRNLLEWGFTVEEAVLLTSANARRRLGLPGGEGVLEEGAPADVTVVGRDGTVLVTLVDGRPVHAAPETGLPAV
jgi:N-acetylglucosamine-6-phosphate deacetylase